MVLVIDLIFEEVAMHHVSCINFGAGQDCIMLYFHHILLFLLLFCLVPYTVAVKGDLWLLFNSFCDTSTMDIGVSNNSFLGEPIQHEAMCYVPS